MATKPRSPNYPAFSLQKALEYARKVYAANHLHRAPRAVVAKAMGYSTLNGGSLTALSALKKFGLLDEDGEGLKITPDALTALVEGAGSTERARVLVKLATHPELFAEMQAAYPGAAPNDEILRAWLLRKGFLQSTVDIPIRAYRETIDLADAQRALYTGESASDGVKQQLKRNEERAEPELGDFIQWEVSGVLQMEAPRRMRGKKEHDGSWWVFVEGSETGIPMEEAIIVEKAKQSDASVQKAAPTMALAAALKVSSTLTADLTAGEREWLRGPLSKAASYRLVVSGDMGPKEIGKLIKLLEAQKAVLDDDEDEDEASQT